MSPLHELAFPTRKKSAQELAFANESSSPNNMLNSAPYYAPLMLPPSRPTMPMFVVRMTHDDNSLSLERRFAALEAGLNRLEVQLSAASALQSVQMQVQIARVHNTHCAMSDALLPLPKTEAGHARPVFVASGVAGPLPRPVGSTPRQFPTTRTQLLDLSLRDLKKLAWFYSSSFGVQDPHATRHEIMLAFLSFVQLSNSSF
ncbi:hypothetical protein SDRG_07184 [Saprolegnia diclina VS20]|uniref:Uncharacterized protein n=1 Tax=Saprolegnia diclina (strain VS20) TaxID=1156394 RepID=T0QLA7_SAPDV|nr:hypothetical protein SDRG_07184 [Saprolegnia diclina VS20]EQC35476.1 hypothetical protein SDRG_07184 [Saprolegnia diclina VS20]|eukprot:XP_008611226.1 hypothetical protein SDRG_07184 [Saprolegnia diclina VS20]